MKTYTLMSPCFFGVEKMLAREIKDLGFEIIKTEDGRVTYKRARLTLSLIGIY